MASLSLITPPTIEPISLEDAKAHCRIDTYDEAARIEAYLMAARQHVEAVTSRQLITATYALRLDGWPCWIDVPKPPLIGTGIAITYIDPAGATQTLAPSQYRVDAPVGPTCGRGRISLASGVSWPSTQAIGESVTVTYQAGYGTSIGSVPQSLRQAMLLLVGHWFENREAITIGAAPTIVPFAVDALLAPFKSRSVQRQ